MANKHIDLTEGPLFPHLIRVAVPSMVGFAVQAVYSLVDMIWIGRISAEAVAGVTIFTTIFWVMDIPNSVIGSSSISLISQSFGARNYDRCRRAIEQTMVFKFLIGLVMTAVLLFSIRYVLPFFTESDAVKDAALDYGLLRIFFIPVMYVTFTVYTALRSIGAPGTAMRLMIASALLNVILDPLFMFDIVPFVGIPGLGLGVFGAALATVLSAFFAFAAGLILFLRGRIRIRIRVAGLFSISRVMARKLTTIGLPTGGEMLLRTFAGIVTMKFISNYGDIATAAFGIGGRLSELFVMAAMGINMGGSTVVGQNLGAEKVDRARRAALLAGLFAMGVMSTAVISGELFPVGMLKIFTEDAAIIAMGVPMIRITVPSYLLLGLMFGLASVFSASGYNTPFVWSSMISRWGVQIPLLFLITVILKWPVIWVWWVYLIAEVCESLIMCGFYLRGKWEEVRV